MEKNFTKDGLILLNKSKGISSFAAINELKRKIKAKKVGHAGTLDPMAEGLMIVMVNDATKFSDDLMKKEKEYYVEMELGYKTDTYDLEGTVIERYEAEINISNAQIIKAVNSFKVSSGTYIRSLVYDIGEKLGVFATMTRLVRTKIGRFEIEDAIDLEKAEAEIDKLKELVEAKRENESFWATKSDAVIRAEKIREIVCFVEIEYVLDYFGINVSNEKYGKLKNGMTVIDTFKKFENISKEVNMRKKIKENQKFKIYVRNRDTNEREFRGIVKIVNIKGDRIYLKRDKYFL